MAVLQKIISRSIVCTKKKKFKSVFILEFSQATLERG